MSSTMIATGHIAVLAKPLSEEERESMMESFYSKDSTLSTNSDGTLIYSDMNANKKYSEREFNGDLFIVGKLNDQQQEFMELVKAAGLEIDANTIQPYTCVWYNGCEPPMADLTKEEFFGKAGWYENHQTATG